MADPDNYFDQRIISRINLQLDQTTQEPKGIERAMGTIGRVECCLQK
jgi:hypothetical protein